MGTVNILFCWWLVETKAMCTYKNKKDNFVKVCFWVVLPRLFTPFLNINIYTNEGSNHDIREEQVL